MTRYLVFLRASFVKIQFEFTRLHMNRMFSKVLYWHENNADQSEKQLTKRLYIHEPEKGILVSHQH